MIDLDNAELQNALQIIQFTRRSLFLTGKAGTGKSTFLRYIAANTKKKHIVLAPTGIAAINAGGSTLHSFFKLPFHPLLPNDSMYSVRNIRNTLKYNSEKIKIIREVELIIIDEISMVRADIIDFIDKVLRVYCRNMREPFGGKQLLLVATSISWNPLSEKMTANCSILSIAAASSLMPKSSNSSNWSASNSRKYTAKATLSLSASSTTSGPVRQECRTCSC